MIKPSVESDCYFGIIAIETPTNVVRTYRNMDVDREYSNYVKKVNEEDRNTLRKLLDDEVRLFLLSPKNRNVFEKEKKALMKRAGSKNELYGSAINLSFLWEESKTNFQQFEILLSLTARLPSRTGIGEKVALDILSQFGIENLIPNHVVITPVGFTFKETNTKIFAGRDFDFRGDKDLHTLYPYIDKEILISHKRRTDTGGSQNHNNDNALDTTKTLIMAAENNSSLLDGIACIMLFDGSISDEEIKSLYYQVVPVELHDNIVFSTTNNLLEEHLRQQTQLY